MIKLSNVVIPPNMVMFRVPERKNAKVETLTIMMDDSTTLEVVKIGNQVKDFIDIAVGDGIVTPTLKQVTFYEFEVDEVASKFSMIAAHDILYAVKFDADEFQAEKNAKIINQVKFSDPNIVSPALDHVN